MRRFYWCLFLGMLIGFELLAAKQYLSTPLVGVQISQAEVERQLKLKSDCEAVIRQMDRIVIPQSFQGKVCFENVSQSQTCETAGEHRKRLKISQW